MRKTVNFYGAGAVEVQQEIDGTSFFPGGAGVWRGRDARGKLPDAFPESPVMFLGHNFDSVKGHRDSVVRGVERLNSGTWFFLLQYLEVAGLSPSLGFYTNALVGLQPEKATGSMVASVRFHDQCRAFLKEQISIVRPRLVVTLGQKAAEELALIRTSTRTIELLHPGNLVYREADERVSLAKSEGEKLKAGLGAVA